MSLPAEVTDVSRRTVERSIQRGTQFLGTLSRSPDIRRVLVEGAGYTEDDHNKGWNLLLTVLGYRHTAPAPAPSRPLGQEQAIAELDQWDAPNFERTRAALAAVFPDQLAYIFSGLSAATGVEAVGSVNTYLDRVLALREGTDPARAGTRDADRAAAELLSRRRIVDDATVARLRQLITTARQLAPAPVPVVTLEETPAYRDAARGLQAWLLDWRGQARQLIRRRDYLISLGLAERRSSADGDGGEEPESSPGGGAEAPGA